jgi:hypothetical protein
VRRIHNELKQLHGLALSLATIHKVLTQQKVEPLRRIRRIQKPKCYQKAIPGERIQMDTCKIAPGRGIAPTYSLCALCAISSSLPFGLCVAPALSYLIGR